MIEAHALQVAQTEQDLQDAAVRAESAATETRGLQERLDAVLARRAAIKAEMDAGTLEPRAAGGLLADADEDARDLQALIAEAASSQARADAVLASAQHKLDNARAELGKAEAAERFNRLQIRATVIDALLMSCVVELAKEGRASGRGNDLSSIWKPSERLNRAVLLRVIPS